MLLELLVVVVLGCKLGDCIIAEAIRDISLDCCLKVSNDEDKIVVAVCTLQQVILQASSERLVRVT